MAKPKAYIITVVGFPEVVLIHMNGHKAFMKAFSDYSSIYSECTFKNWLKIARCTRHKYMDKEITPVIVNGGAAWQVGPQKGNSIYYFYDDNPNSKLQGRLSSHVMDVLNIDWTAGHAAKVINQLVERYMLTLAASGIPWDIQENMKDILINELGQL